MQLSPTSPSCHCPDIPGKVAAYSWTKNLSIIPGEDPFDAIFRPSFWGAYRPPDRINDCLRPFAATASVFLHSEWSPYHLLTLLSRNPPPYGFVLDNNRRADTGGVSCIINPEDRIPTTIAATVARTCRKKITGKTRLYVRRDFPLELGNTAKRGERRWRRGRRHEEDEKKVKRSFPCGKYDSLPARDVDRESLD